MFSHHSECRTLQEVENAENELKIVSAEQSSIKRCFLIDYIQTKSTMKLIIRSCIEDFSKDQKKKTSKNEKTGPQTGQWKVKVVSRIQTRFVFFFFLFFCFPSPTKLSAKLMKIH
jgi:hypothetical protein